jgi:hypothetical protein
MVYLQDDIFTSRFLTRNNAKRGYRSLHFGVTDNLFLNYLASLSDAEGIRLHRQVAPYELVLLHSSQVGTVHDQARTVLEFVQANNVRVQVERVSRRKSFRRAAELRRQGVPLILVMNEEDSWRGNYIAFPRMAESELVPFGQPQRIVDLLSLNDRKLHEVAVAVRDAAVVRAASAAQVSSIVADGSIAAFFLGEDESNVERLTGDLAVGEVLGFDWPGRAEVGPDIFDHRAEGRLCYASRRI